MKIQKKIYLTITVFSGIIFVFVGFLIIPVLKDIKEKSDDFLLEKEILINLEAKLNSLKDFETNYEQITSGLLRFENLFVNKEEPIQFISFLEKIAKEEGITISISPQSLSEKEEEWEAIGFSISVSGTYSNFAKFLEKLEFGNWLVNIESINIIRMKDEKAEGIESKGIKANVFFRVYKR